MRNFSFLKGSLSNGHGRRWLKASVLALLAGAAFLPRSVLANPLPQQQSVAAKRSDNEGYGSPNAGSGVKGSSGYSWRAHWHPWHPHYWWGRRLLHHHYVALPPVSPGPQA